MYLATSASFIKIQSLDWKCICCNSYKDFFCIVKCNSVLFRFFTRKNNNTYRNLEDILAFNTKNISNHSENIYPKGCLLINAKRNNINCPFWNLNLSVSHERIYTKNADQMDDSLFPMVNFPCFCTMMFLWLVCYIHFVVTSYISINVIFYKW